MNSSKESQFNISITTNVPEEKVHNPPASQARHWYEDGFERKCVFRRPCKRPVQCDRCLQNWRRGSLIEIERLQQTWGLESFLTISVTAQGIEYPQEAYLVASDLRKKITKWLSRRRINYVALAAVGEKLLTPHVHLLTPPLDSTELDALRLALINWGFMKVNCKPEPIQEPKDQHAARVLGYMFDTNLTPLLHFKPKRLWAFTCSKGGRLGISISIKHGYANFGGTEQ